MQFTITLILITLFFSSLAQNDTTLSKLTFQGDFRFRFEQDWNSKKSDGTFRDDRTRFRYRLRVGAVYTNSWYEVGLRLRTGQLNKQQDPQLTLGNGFKEFGTLPIGLEKAYFQGKGKSAGFWMGKNTFPFEKSNELFWSDNVFPEGISVWKSFLFESNFIDSLNIKAGHFIMSTMGRALDKDAYFQGGQVYLKFLDNRVELFPAIYLFKNIPNIPDVSETYLLDYSIFHTGLRAEISKKRNIVFELDYYNNLQDYDLNDSISNSFKNQTSSLVIALGYGTLKQKGDWIIKASYAYLERYSAVDFMAQNDWARWDYSQFNSPDGRLTNFNGVEIVGGIKLNQKINLKAKYYFVEQLLPFGTTKETGNRFRFDIDIKF
ncbi:MAG: putative porin [Crocinitomicaceae bacterium]